MCYQVGTFGRGMEWRRTSNPVDGEMSTDLFAANAAGEGGGNEGSGGALDGYSIGRG